LTLRAKRIGSRLSTPLKPNTRTLT
jgi:hypothetical protein